MPSADGPPPIRLPNELDVCRHGRELRRLTTQESLGRWLVWGHYACGECSVVVLDHYEAMPGEARVAGRRMPIQFVSGASTPHVADGGDAGARQ
jgi:hypothetical protein